MKTPDEIKKGLAVCATLDGDCENCPYDDGKNLTCVDRSRRDALAYIIHLESRIAQVERERDALSRDMHQLQGAICAYCKNLYRPDAANHTECRVFGDLSRFGDVDERSPLVCGKFGWRGVCPENTKDDADA